MTKINFSLENLRRLMAASPAWQTLPKKQKENIEQYIKNKDRAVMLYVFQQLQEEADAHEIARDSLARKVLTVKSPEKEDIRRIIGGKGPASAGKL